MCGTKLSRVWVSIPFTILYKSVYSTRQLQCKCIDSALVVIATYSMCGGSALHSFCKRYDAPRCVCVRVCYFVYSSHATSNIRVFWIRMQYEKCVYEIYDHIIYVTHLVTLCGRYRRSCTDGMLQFLNDFLVLKLLIVWLLHFLVIRTVVNSFFCLVWIERNMKSLIEDFPWMYYIHGKFRNLLSSKTEHIKEYF